MIAVLGFATIIIFLYVTMTKKLSIQSALIGIPVIAAIIGGFGFDIGKMMIAGVIKVTPSAMIPIFAVIYFGIMIDAGLFDPMVNRILKLVKGDPVKITIGAAVLHADSSAIFTPIVPAMAVGIAWVLFACYYIGKKERKRLGVMHIDEHTFDGLGEDQSAKRPQLFWFNCILTVLMIVVLLMDIMPMATIFMIGFALAITVNYPNLEEQTKRLKAYAGEVLMIVTLIFSAGCFTGILSETKMITEMAKTLVSLIPEHMGSLLPLSVAVTSMPLSLVFPTDAYYFGVLPVIYEMAVSLGIDSVQIGRAAVLGQMTVGFPVSPLAAATLVLISVSRVNLIDHQKFMFFWAFGTTLIMTVVCYLTGALTF